MGSPMHLSCLPASVHNILSRLKTITDMHRFILGGGTALALQLGHRISVDLDFFTQNTFSTESLFQNLKAISSAIQLLQDDEGTLTVIADETKISLFHYPYPFIEPPAILEGVSVAGILDVSSMKVIAISQRGAKRDFIDLYFAAQDTPFRKIAENMAMRFGKERINPLHIGKSLVYFEDADVDPEPHYLIKNPPKWEDIKKFFKKNVQQMVLDLKNAIEL